MGTTTYVFKASDYPPINFGCEWGDHWLGEEVEFTLAGHTFRGECIGTERHRLANGIHDILEVELLDEEKQVKIQGHRQMFRRIS